MLNQKKRIWKKVCKKPIDNRWYKINDLKIEP